MEFLPPYKAYVYRNRPLDFSPSVEVAACYVECAGKFLLLKRSIGKPQENTWGVPAGKFEEGESSLAAVHREVFEEVGIRLNNEKLDDLGKVYVRYPHTDFVYHMFHQDFLEFPEITLSDEHQEYRWVSFDEAMLLPLISGGVEALHHFQALAKKVKLPRRDFYFIRHGETDVNVDPCIKRVDYDLPLNANGRAQALSLQDAIDKLNLKAVCSSPLQRAQETKDIICSGRDMEHVEIHDLGECKAGVWTKMVRLEKGRGFHVCDLVEAFLARTLHGVNSALQEGEPTLIVAHGGIHWAMCYYMMIENHPWKIGNCKLVHFRPVGMTEWEASIFN
ncbi:hypothetical protein SCG7109_BA_00060 [Chlamydiales bacterium SCGC AG-110-M15]|nr:hypothetical protein SCG7109_BA_00060 [Chlamydiales bacterium SCGC AG-110-M15]